MNRFFHFRTSSSQLGPLEQRLLEDGHDDLAYTTLMTTLDRLFKKKVLTRQAEGRAFRYAPRYSREELHREAAGDAFRRLLDASPGASVPLSYLVEILTERDAHLLDDLWQLVESKRRQLRHREIDSRDKERT